MVARARSRSVYSLITILVTLAALSSGRHSVAARASGAAQAAETGTLLLAPEDTSLNIDAVNYSTHPLLMAYTWPDNQIANTILLKFDLSALPAGATVEQAVVHLALVESDTTADATYTMAAHKLVGMNPIVAAATGYTADGATAWTPSACCYNGVPLAQSDLSAPYALLAVDKTPGFKAWTITTMVREWLAGPASNFGLVLNSDPTKARDRYRFFASTKHADVTLWPVLEITYSMPSADTTPPAISAVASSSITGVAARIGWTTDESSDSQVEYGATTAYGSATSVNASMVTAHSVQLSGLLDARIYHYRVRSGDAAGNRAVSGDFTFTTLDKTLPSVSMSAPAAGATVSSTVTVSAQASDNVGVASVQFRLDGANLGARDTTAPYAISWNTTTATAGAHTLAAVARDAAGNARTSTAITVTVSNDTTAPVVSITGPAAGATVSGPVTVAANATDNVGVAGVQFKLDGANLGTEDTTAPYSWSWTTTTATDGSHTLTAVARDAAGNQTTSAGVTVTVSNAPPPPGGGLAALYPGDAGIENHPDVIFVERFEEPTLADLFTRWTDVLNGAAMSLSSDVPAGSPGARSLNIPWAGGGANNGGHLYKQLSPGVDDTLYVRYYIKYPASGKYHHSGIWMGGNNPSLSWPNPQAGIKPVGNDRFIAGPSRTRSRRFDHYNYWMDMRPAGDGTYWGNFLLNNPKYRRRRPAQWMCVEHMVKLNNPVDGVQR